MEELRPHCAENRPHDHNSLEYKLKLSQYKLDPEHSLNSAHPAAW